MSVNYNVYIGPYIQAYNPAKPGFHEYYGCPSETCNKDKKKSADKFCPKCGTAITLLKVPKKAKVTFHVYDECDDRLNDLHVERRPLDKADYEIFTPNVGKFGHQFTDRDDAQIIEFNETIMLAEVNRFKIEFSNEILKLEKAFGEKDVKVMWGVITYYS
jgi:hypothetical protein